MTSSVAGSSEFINAKEFIFLDKPIISVDIETLDLKPSAVIYDIGVVVTEVLPLPGQLWTLADMQRASSFGLCQSLSIRPSLIQQVVAGRTIDKETVEWHQGRCAKLGFNFMEDLMSRSKEEVSAQRVFETIQTLCDQYKVTEVWMNHPSFDSTRIESYFGSMQFKKMPWFYKKEYDIATAKLAYRKRLAKDQPDLTKNFKQNNTTGESHTGLGDCCYNLAIVSLSGIFTPLSDKAQYA